MRDKFVSSINLKDMPLWDKIKKMRVPLWFVLEITARCNNNCRHCYINLPAKDQVAESKEMTVDEIERIADEAIDLGALWCRLTGGEPLLRPDFFEIYTMLKRKGLLVSVFTNSTLINPKHIALFKKYPPRDIELTIYGVTKETYERVTRQPGSFNAFMRGLNLLLENGVKVRLKAMALRSNIQEMQQISCFGRAHTRNYYRFDPQLHLRVDRDPLRNEEIKAERISPQEIVKLEREDPQRYQALKNQCEQLPSKELPYPLASSSIIYCAAGTTGFEVTYDGNFMLCSSLRAPQTLFNLRKGSLRNAWENHVPMVRAVKTHSQSFLKCVQCPLISLCLWCPGHAHLETGDLEGSTPFFCEVAHARAQAIQITDSSPPNSSY